MECDDHQDRKRIKQHRVHRAVSTDTRPPDPRLRDDRDGEADVSTANRDITASMYAAFQAGRTAWSRREDAVIAASMHELGHKCERRPTAPSARPLVYAGALRHRGRQS